MNGKAGAALDRLVEALALVAGALLCALVVLVCLDVAARTFKLFAMPWSLDVSEYALYAITFLGAPWVLRENGHSPSEAFNETVEEATQSLYPLIAENGMDWMYANCSTTAQRGALDWFKAHGV